MSVWDDRWAHLGRRAQGDMSLKAIKQEVADLVIGRVLSAFDGNKTKTAMSLGTSPARVREAAHRVWPEAPRVTTFKATGAHMGYLDYTSDGQAVEGSWGFGFLVQRETMREVSNLQEIVGATRLVVTVEVIE